MTFGAHSTAEEVARGIDLGGRLAVVTGASGGLGAETARVLAAAGATVVMAARDAGKSAAAAAAIRAQHPGACLEALRLDLADLESVRRAAAELLERHAAVDILANNAGVMACPLARTREGCELQFGTNHVGHFLFTCRLLPALRRAVRPRVVCLTSAGHRTSGIDFEDPHFERRAYDKWIAYGQSKTANALFAVGLARRLLAKGATANAVHPGMIHTELGRHLDRADLRRLRERAGAHGLALKSIPQGAATVMWAAMSPKLQGVTGRYLEDCRISKRADDRESVIGYMGHALDPESAERLWSLSETLVGERFP